MSEEAKLDERKTDTIVKRVRALRNALASVANDIRYEYLEPGVQIAFSKDGVPVCAFGHAVQRAADRVGGGCWTKPEQTIEGNFAAMARFLNGEFNQQLSLSTQHFLNVLLLQISNANDEAFRGSSPAALRLKWRERLIDRIDLLASSLWILEEEVKRA